MESKQFDPLELVPLEIWLRILDNLASKYICNVAQVSKAMASLANDPILWSKRGASVKKRKIWSNGFDFLDIPRFSKLARLDLSSQVFGEVISFEKLESLFSHITSLNSVVELNLSKVSMNEVCPALLGEAVSLLQKIDLSYTGLSTPQSQEILKNMKTSTTLCSVVLRGVDLSDVSPTLLSDGLSKAASIDLANASFTMEQVTCIFRCVPTSHTLKDMTLTDSKVALVPVELIVKAIKKLEKANFSCVGLSEEQSEAIFHQIKAGSSLRELVLDRNDLSQVPEKLVGPAVKLLEKVSLNLTRLTKGQSRSIFDHICTSTSLIDLQLQGANLYQVSLESLSPAIARLVKINLQDTCLESLEQANQIHLAISSSSMLKDVNLKNLGFRQVFPSIISQCVIPPLRRLNLSNCSLTKLQMTPVLQNISTFKTIEDLNLENLNLSRVPADLLAAAIAGLKKVNLDRTQLIPDQCDAIFSRMAASTRLQDLSTYSVNLSHVKPALLTSALTPIKKINLDRSQLTTGQLTDLISSLDATSPVESLILDCMHMSRVSPDVISKGVGYLRHVSLANTELTTEQITMLLQAVLQSTTLEDVCLEWVELANVDSALIQQSKHIVQFI